MEEEADDLDSTAWIPVIRYTVMCFFPFSSTTMKCRESHRHTYGREGTKMSQKISELKPVKCIQGKEGEAVGLLMTCRVTRSTCINSRRTVGGEPFFMVD